MTPQLPVAELRGLCVRRARREVLHGIDLHIGAGELIALLGPNGAGKSTMLAAIAGSIAPSAGSVVRSGRVAMLMQTPGLAARSASANVELALGWWGVARGERRSLAASALERMQAAHLAQRHALTLSGGERRRVHLARAVAVQADLLLLDEPFDGLDSRSHEELRDDTVAELRRAGSSAVVVLHDRADAWAMADRLLVLADGALHADGPPMQLLVAPPTRRTAEILGYDGDVSTTSGSMMTRASQVFIDAAGSVRGTVTRLVPGETGTRVRVEVAGGTLWSVVADSRVHMGDEVRLRIAAQADFDATGRRL